MKRTATIHKKRKKSRQVFKTIDQVFCPEISSWTWPSHARACFRGTTSEGAEIRPRKERGTEIVTRRIARIGDLLKCCSRVFLLLRIK
jgi:hypothetical protein